MVTDSLSQRLNGGMSQYINALKLVTYKEFLICTLKTDNESLQISWFSLPILKTPYLNPSHLNCLCFHCPSSKSLVSKFHCLNLLDNIHGNSRCTNLDRRQHPTSSYLAQMRTHTGRHIEHRQRASLGANNDVLVPAVEWATRDGTAAPCKSLRAKESQKVGQDLKILLPLLQLLDATGLHASFLFLQDWQCCTFHSLTTLLWIWTQIFRTYSAACLISWLPFVLPDSQLLERQPGKPLTLTTHFCFQSHSLRSSAPPVQIWSHDSGQIIRDRIFGDSNKGYIQVE